VDGEAVTLPDPADAVHSAGQAIVEAPLVVPGRPGESTARRVAAVVLPPLVVLGLIVGVWYLVTYAVLEPRRRFILPPAHDVIEEGFLTWANLSEMLDGLWSSTKVAAIGLAVSIVLGVLLAVAMSQSRLIERAIFPPMVALQAIPILAMVPMIALWFDTNQTARVIVCVIISIFPIVLNTHFGLLSAEGGLHDLVTLHHGGRVTRLTKVMFPSALPAMFAGLRISAGLSVIGGIVGDFFFGRGDVGIGQLIRRYSANTNYAELLPAAVILSSLLGIAVFLAFGALQQAIIGRWHDVKAGGGR
jgi:NitT/TauT family transport system permease protein